MRGMGQWASGPELWGPSWTHLAEKKEKKKRTLYWVWKSENGRIERLQIVVPRSSIPQILHSIHDQISGGFLGITRTVAKLRERFYWSINKEDVEDWTYWRVTCAATRGPQTQLWGKLHKYNVRHPFKKVATDLAERFPISRRGNRQILVVADMVRSLSTANHRCPRNSQNLCGKLDFTLWCPIGAAHRPRKEFWSEPVLWNMQTVEDQRKFIISL